MSAHTAPALGAELVLVTARSVMMYANSATGNSLFLVVQAKTGERTTYEMRWDPVDSMAVIRHERHKFFLYYAMMGTEWFEGERLVLSARDGRFDMIVVGTIEQMAYGRAVRIG
jgi:hypothetical protein